MSEGGRNTNNSLVNFGDLTKPVNTLIEKISEAIGACAQPWQIKRLAKANADVASIQAEAQAKADLIQAKSKLEISEFERRGIERMLIEEGKNQENIEGIAAKAIPHVTEGARPEEIDHDWIRYFFDRSKLISDEEMQQLWSKILAGEANSPKSFSKKTIDIVSAIDKEDANLFTNLCRFVWNFGGLTPIRLDPNHSIYQKFGINCSSVSQLQ
jgi:hypothetical protein